MARTVQDICDRCGAVRKSENHWWAVFYKANPWTSIHVHPFDHDAKIGVKPGEAGYEEFPHRILCGEACALAEVSEFLGRGAKGG